MTVDSTGREVIGIRAAAEIAGVSLQTIGNWWMDGIIQAGDEPDALHDLNAGKSGRKHKRYYYADEVRDAGRTTDTANLITIADAATSLGVTERTIHRIRERNKLSTFTGLNNILYLRKDEVDALTLGVDYFHRITPKGKRAKMTPRRHSRR